MRRCVLAGHARCSRILLCTLAIVQESCGWRQSLLTTLLEELLVRADVLRSGIEVNDVVVADVVRMILMHLIVVGKTGVLPRCQSGRVDRVAQVLHTGVY